MALASIAGVELSYRTAGVEDGRPVVFIHGFTGNYRNWALQVKALSAAGGYRMLSADDPGHGDSSAPDDPAVYELGNVAEIVHQLAVGLDFAPAIVIGHSMGGAIAEEYAIRFPDDVRALVLVGSAGGASGPERLGMVEQVAALEPAYRAGGMGAVYDQRLLLTPPPGYAALPETTRTFLRNEFLRTSWHGYAYGARALHERKETLTALATFDKPTLIVTGENESKDLQRVATDLALTLPNATRAVIDHAGHSPQFENAAAFDRVLFDFLATLR